MDTDILIGHKDCLYGEDLLDEFTKDYQWSSLLDTADKSPSEILAEATPHLVPPLSPNLSLNSSQSSNSDSGSEDDSKNSSSGTSARLSSPIDWMSSFDEDPSSNLNLEDVEQFLQKTAPINFFNTGPINKVKQISGPVMSIENGVIKGVHKESVQEMDIACQTNFPKGKDLPQITNPYFKVVNEHFVTNISNSEKKVLSNDQLTLVIDQKKAPTILKRNSNILINTKPANIMIPAENIVGGKIAITPLPTNHNREEKTCQIRVSPPRSNIVISPKPGVEQVPEVPTVQNGTIPQIDHHPISESIPTLDLTQFSEAEIRAFKKQQRMIKNRESACQSRQKKKEYVTTLEQRLLEAEQEIVRLKQENKLLRDQLDGRGRSRKIPRLDTSIFIPKKNIAVLFAMVFMVSLNFNFMSWNMNPEVVGPPSTYSSSRHLLWSMENSDIAAVNDDISNITIVSDCMNTTNIGDFIKINQTESLRIAGDLNRWIGGGKTLNWTYDAPRRKRKMYITEEKFHGPLPETYKLFNKLNIDSNIVDGIDYDIPRSVKNIREKTRLRRLRKSRDIAFPESMVYDYGTFYGKPMRKALDDLNMDDFGEWNALLQALHRRDDTFYIVGVGKGQHLLLPAVSHNVTRPPKMALILPAKTGNDSVLTDHVTLMHIECSVMNTSLVQLKSENFPRSVRKNTKEVPEKPEPKTNNNVRRTKKDVVDASLLDILLESSNNASNYLTVQNKQSNKIHDIDVGHLLTKYEEKKNGTINLIVNNILDKRDTNTSST